MACALIDSANAASLNKLACSSGQCFIRKDPNGLVYRGCANKENLSLGVDPNKQCAYQGDSLWYFCDGDLCNKKQLGDYGVCGYKPKYEQAAYNPCDSKCDYNPSGLFPDSNNKNGFIKCDCKYRTGPYTGKRKTCISCKPFYLNCPYGTAFDEYTKVCSKAAYAKYQRNFEEPAYPVPTYRRPVYKPKKAVYVAPAYEVPVYGVPYKQPVYLRQQTANWRIHGWNAGR
ncbi:unnamed protein product [Owenia fusiformis]|uniref:Uncharacterized protein n=1 Tax=Owenia fusiformis TaxID=6347 RepID=A0A8J1U5F2_OWEFU|nr:unnamed protein product [Owenia fusiformis]